VGGTAEVTGAVAEGAVAGCRSSLRDRAIRITPTRRTANAAIERYHPIRGPHVSQAAAPLTGVHDP